MSSDITTQQIVFSNGNQAQMIAVAKDAGPRAILQTLNLPQPRAIIVLVGGAAGLNPMDDAGKARLFQLFSRGIARAALGTGAIIVDGGTEAGTMALMGQGVADRGHKTPLIGFAPSAKVTFPGGPIAGDMPDTAPLDQNHSHFVLVQGQEWGDEIATMAMFVQSLAVHVPVVTLVINGGAVAKAALLESVRNRWNILVMRDSGRLADEIAGLWQVKQQKKKLDFIADPAMAEIITDGKIELCSLNDEPQVIEAALTRAVGNPTLKHAWSRFALYDQNAKIYQKDFRNLQQWILLLGVFATALALAASQAKTYFEGFPLAFSFMIWNFNFTLSDVVHLPIVAMPISISALIALSTKFNPGNKYILLRASAERVKREIFTFRAHAGIYNAPQLAGQSADSLLQQKIEELGRQLLETEMKDTTLFPYLGPIPPVMIGATAGDDGFSMISAERYDEIRIGDQINFHRYKVGKLGDQLRKYQRLIYAAGALGSFLAAIGFELWIALTTTLTTVFTTYLLSEQVEYTLTRNNQTLLEIQNVRAWWRSLAPEQRDEAKNVDGMVDAVERTLDEQLSGWVRQMSDALASIRAEQAKKENR